ncbi:uncharacterized protein K452DRAFT_293259 [Aplosporella prunicola CBS 121167]|uniref:Uncharacterized protein n=1 Tax=Aplosporella prunicola CBS 121167 TaxID=1176127 RepID=A0A6A6AUP2_9PEZI|nr:uncharacterized protein K452DRAFT_293259 [Aplosporella prunicola CBS 121167]KAF2135390.1 hypothetical protein K452DRAFT_293259 [Aplosporella prunicola CBS 121167]
MLGSPPLRNPSVTCCRRQLPTIFSSLIAPSTLSSTLSPDHRHTHSYPFDLVCLLGFVTRPDMRTTNGVQTIATTATAAVKLLFQTDPNMVTRPHKDFASLNRTS